MDVYNSVQVTEPQTEQSVEYVRRNLTLAFQPLFAPDSPTNVLKTLVESWSNTIKFYINGAYCELNGNEIHPQATLADFLRVSLNKKGTKIGCGEGGCGACTVVYQLKDERDGKIKHLAVNSCLAPLISIDGKHIITVEGLGTAKNPHPLHERMFRLHGSQCGYCTPGIIMSIYALLRNAMYDKEYRLTVDDIELRGALDGNLCRCTGYKSILDAAKTFVGERLLGIDGVGAPGLAIEANLDAANQSQKSLMDDPTGLGYVNKLGCGRPDCCQLQTKVTPAGNGSTSGEDSSSISNDSDPASSPPSTPEEELPPIVKPSFPLFNFRPYTPGTELIFPPRLHRHEKVPLCLGSAERVWLRPTTLEQLLEIKSLYPKAKLITGATEVQVEVKFKAALYEISVYVGDLRELQTVTLPTAEHSALTFGANLPLAELETICAELYKKLGPKRGATLEAIRHQLRYFAGKQIRNVACAAGNLVTASPISDLNPVLVAVGAILTAKSQKRGEFELPLKEFFTGYRKTPGRSALPEDAVLVAIKVPLPKADEEDLLLVKSFKQAKRKDDDIAIVTSGMALRVNDKGLIGSCTLAYGGMAPFTVQATKTAEFLVGKDLSDETLEKALDILGEELHLPSNVPGGMATFRKTLTLSFFFKFWHYVVSTFKSEKGDPDILEEIHRLPSKGVRDNSDPYALEVVGRQVPHLSGMKHVTGEAVYSDDLPQLGQNEGYGHIVHSEKPHAKILKIDPTKALTMPGVICWVDHRDLPYPEANWWGHASDEPFFAVDKVISHGQPIGMILANDKISAQAAARAVIIEYEDLKPILTIEEAIEAQSFHPYGKFMNRGLPSEEAFKKCEHVFEGESRMGGQEHFYLETQACTVWNKLEDGEFEIFSSTQSLQDTQLHVAQVLGVPANRIVARAKRLGGGFGGKETRAVPLAAILALACNKAKRSGRCQFDRDQDMITSGQRHPFLFKWKIGCDKSGKLLALDADLYANAGYSTDISPGVVDRALAHADGVYYIPNVAVRGYCCNTNTMSNTAFRGFGGPQGMYMAESYLSVISDKLGIDIDHLREINMYKEGQRTHYHQPLIDWHVPKLWKRIKAEAHYDHRKLAIAEFNRTHKWRKRGIAIIPTKFGIAFGVKHLNQGHALVHVYTDGSVLLSHAGIEMGQGLYAKCAMVAAQELNVPLETVFISESNSSAVANGSATAASSGSDLQGMATKMACAELRKRLEPYYQRMGPHTPLNKIAKAAYLDRVCLSAFGHYVVPKIGYTWHTTSDEPGDLFYYFTQGVGISEVEVDTLTGDHTVLRTDIKMDVGRSINPAVDYGQVEGAFIQGMGLFTMEESLWHRASGQLFTRGPGAYKIPGFSDIPQVFNVSLLRDADWPTLGTVASSKGVGEPPLFLGSAVHFAIRDALKSVRKDSGIEESLPCYSPLTSERIRLACGDHLLKKGTVERKEGEKDFFVII